MFTFINNREPVFWSGCTFRIATSDVWQFQLLPSLMSARYCQSASSFKFSHSTKCVVYLITVWIRISLMTNDEHLFTCFFTIHISSWVKCLFQSFAHFNIGLFSYYWILQILYICWILVIYQIYDLWILSPICVACFFIFLIRSFCCCCC